VGLQPTVWYNDAGGVTLGLRSRDDYLGRFEQNVALITRSMGWGTDDGVKDVDFFLRAKNPVFLRAPNLSETFDAYNIEGRYGGTAVLSWNRRAHLGFGPQWNERVSLQWVAVDDARYLDPGYYDNVGTVEVQLGSGVSNEVGKWQLSLRGSAGGGLVYNRAGLAVSGRPELDPFYARAYVEGLVKRAIARKLTLGVRGYVAGATGSHPAPKQRQIYFQGSDPLAQLYNPFLRSRGALLVGEDFHYQSPGGAGIRGVDPRVSSDGVAAVNLELERTLATNSDAHLFRRVSLAAFGDVARSLGGRVQPLTGNRIGWIGDAGIGLRAQHQIGDTQFTTRMDFPLYVSQPELAQDRAPGDNHFEFRWVFSFEPAL
jgi:hypothetical protein